MNIYRHRENRNLYTLSHLILDIYHLNNNEFAGIYADPYCHTGEQIKFQNKDKEKCKSFVDDNFELIASS